MLIVPVEHHSYGTYQIMKLSFPWAQLIKQVEAVKIFKFMEESRSLKVMDNKKSVPAEDEEFHADRDEKSKQVKDLEEEKLKLMKDIEELRSKISAMDSKLVEVSTASIDIRIWGSGCTLKLHIVHLGTRNVTKLKFLFSYHYNSMINVGTR